MKMIFSVLLGVSLATSAAAQTNNAGFVQGLWYDRTDVFVDEPVRIYVAIRNNTGAELSGTVTFFVSDNQIARKSVAALDGRIIESWADWTPTYGEHTVRAELSRLELNSVDGTEELTTVTASLAEDIVLLDYDTDNDGVGNQADNDDDGDGIGDSTEIANGTDPLIFDTPPPETPEDTAPTERETTDTVATTTESTSGAGGLESYLTPSRAQTLLADVTNWSQEVKARVDTIREERSGTTTLGSDIPTVDGFGEVERTTDERYPFLKTTILSIIPKLIQRIWQNKATAYQLK